MRVLKIILFVLLLNLVGSEVYSAYFKTNGAGNWNNPGIYEMPGVARNGLSTSARGVAFGAEW